ncbi:MAG TPA: hypothetical protein DDZ22_02665 [Massilia sp.]|nr:hypothetical protein [Massilia sp.]
MDQVPNYEKIGRFIYGIARAGLGEEALSAMAADGAHPERAARAARLLQHYARLRSGADLDVLAQECAAALEEGQRLARGEGAL